MVWFFEFAQNFIKLHYGKMLEIKYECAKNIEQCYANKANLFKWKLIYNYSGIFRFFLASSVLGIFSILFNF